MKKSTQFVRWVLALTLLLGCRPSGSNVASSSASPKSSRPVVAVTSNVLDYFVGRLAGDWVDVRFPIQGQSDPADWHPNDAEIQAFQAADLIVTNGANYEPWLNQVTLPEDRLINTSSEFNDQLIEVQNAVTHSHGPGGEHSHSGTAPQVWLDFTLAAKQAHAIAESLKKLLPGDQAAIQRNLESLTNDLDQLDQSMMAAANRIKDQPVIFSHPVYQYLQRRYQLKGESVHWEPQDTPDEAAIDEFKKLLASHPAKLMIWEAEPTAETKTLLDGLGLQWLVFAHGGNRGQNRDWLQTMQGNIERLNEYNEPAAELP